MGYHVHYDGRCYICNNQAEEFCDSCMQFICDEHSVLKQKPKTHTSFKFCPKCAKDPNPDVTHTTQRFVNPKLDRMR